MKDSVHDNTTSSAYGSFGGGVGGVGDDDVYELFDNRRQLYDADERALIRSLLMTMDSYNCQVRH